MAVIRTTVEVRLWEHQVGALVETEDGVIVFEYSEDFRRTGLEISPVHLPLSLRGPVRFDGLKSEAFERLPGVFADSLPDAFGRKVIRAYLSARGREHEALSPCQRLLYVGRRAIGALTYHPAEDLPAGPHEAHALELRALAEDARGIVQGRTEVAIPEIYRIGSSAGGVRPKAVVLFNPSTGEIRSAYAPLRAGDVSGILKFDGVGGDSTEDSLGRPRHYNRVEAAYSRMSVAAGIRMSDVKLVGDDDYAHLFIPRFDFDPSAERLHQHTFGGLIHVDYNDPGASSYEEYLRRILSLGMPYASLEEGYRRAVFNVLAVNQDDHVKNLSFHMHRDGRWALTPAYDVTFAKGSGFTSRHQMSIRGKREGLQLSDLLDLGEEMTIRRPRRIVDEVRDAVADFAVHAEATGTPLGALGDIQAELRRRDRQIFG
ncbi:MAG: type II toxin-antitoxin system HipA family toxin [Gemmatimonadota bacterium]|nr:type II toxin-antitoxin system HipA family toxin [Gemmatimonadota bacterium]